MNPATTQQLKAIHAVLHKHGLLHDKANIIDSFTNGRSKSSKDMTMEEARELLMSFQSASPKEGLPMKELFDKDKGPMVRKLFAMCYEMGWITESTTVSTAGKIERKKDYSRLYGWVLKYGYLGKELRKYTYTELPKLLSQFEFKIYKPYIENLSK